MYKGTPAINKDIIIEHSQPSLGIEEKKALLEVYKSTYISEGPLTRKFESDLADYLEISSVRCLPSGYVALLLSITAMGGDSLKVIMPSYVCREVYDAVLLSGAEPVLCDIGEDFNISVEEIKKKLAVKAKKKSMLLLPHMYGLPADIDKYLEIGIPVLEDCAHTIGARYKGKCTGSFGVAGILSFETTKMMTTGYGGAIVSKNKKFIEKIERLRVNMPLINGPQYSFYFSDIQSAIGIAQLKKIPSFIEKRARISERYFREFENLPIVLPRRYPDRDHIFYRFTIGSSKKKPSQVMKQAIENGFKIRQVVPALHRHLRLNKRDFPMTEIALNQWVSIPIYPALKQKDISVIVRGIKRIYE
ncbi:MAG: DegT/DnrJ/EryC1/StrS family aminotransferase [Nitrospira sp.]|nr:DegT/DnrJ/EryC1/StrS family aminotransferase [Nitrospira sp.]